MLSYLWVAVGGAAGSLLRFWLSGFVAARWGETFPFGTLVINVTGSFCIGFLNEITSVDGRYLVPGYVRAGILIGILGGYTTFSSFSLQTLNLMREGEAWRAAINVVSSVFFCLLAVWAGFVLGRLVNVKSL